MPSIKKYIILIATAALIVLAVTIFALTRSSNSNKSTSYSTKANTNISTTFETNNTAIKTNAKTYTVDVWADNWFVLYINGAIVGEDSVPITTERSFNKESFTFTAVPPLTIAIEAKDFKETNSGLEYIGKNNQQMGDGGLIAQIKDASGAVVAATDNSWSALVVHKAPLDKACEKSAVPDTDCKYTITDTPNGWYQPAYDVSAWAAATEYTEAAVGPKDGYNEVTWDQSAKLIWGSDLEQDNTILLRKPL